VESFAWIVKAAAFTAVVGVPEITPAELNAKPAGSVPELSNQVYGAVPPVAASVTLVYAVPTVPAGSGEVVVIDSVAGGVLLPPPQPANNAEIETAQSKPNLPNRIRPPGQK